MTSWAGGGYIQIRDYRKFESSRHESHPAAYHRHSDLLIAAGSDQQLVWVTRNPDRTFGHELLQEIRSAAQPERSAGTPTLSATRIWPL